VTLIKLAKEETLQAVERLDASLDEEDDVVADGEPLPTLSPEA
jgi:DNA gyrase subunit A